MKRLTTLCMGMIVASLLCFDLQQEATAESSSKEPGVKRALLIGINKYQAVPKLQGSLNDIETMRQVLITRWGFSEGNIRLLTDEQATRDGMLAALNQFVHKTDPNDTVYIHYSGHGSQVVDLNGDEPDDKLDETLVPQDGRTGLVPDITDDELDAIFAQLPTKNAFIVLDSCHSGTATRSLDIRTRSIPQDTRVEIYRNVVRTDVRTRGNIQLLPAQYVLMTGAASHQEALDGPVNGRYHGFFSYALSKSLSASSATASPREIFRGIETELKRIQTHFGRSSMPEPQLEAPPELLEKPL
jgi:caspase domain-containing protein